MESPAKAYGDGRSRSGVSYGEVERAAIAILKSERRPTVEAVREALGTGSPDTIATALKRFWRNLGARIDGDPAALTRMPGEIAEIADGMWQRALKLAGQAAAHDDNAARERLRQIELEVDIRRRSFELREQEIDTEARERERALADARDHLLSLSKALSREQAINEAHERRIANLETDIATYRQQIAGLIDAATTKARPRPPRAAPARATPPSTRSKPARSKHKGNAPQSASASTFRPPPAEKKGTQIRSETQMTQKPRAILTAFDTTSWLTLALDPRYALLPSPPRAGPLGWVASHPSQRTPR